MPAEMIDSILEQSIGQEVTLDIIESCGNICERRPSIGAPGKRPSGGRPINLWALLLLHEAVADTAWRERYARRRSGVRRLIRAASPKVWDGRTAIRFVEMIANRLGVLLDVDSVAC